MSGPVSVEKKKSGPAEMEKKWKKWLHFWNCAEETEVVPICIRQEVGLAPAPRMKRRLIVVKVGNVTFARLLNDYKRMSTVFGL